MIRAIALEDSPHLVRGLTGPMYTAPSDGGGISPWAHTTRGDQGHLMLKERVAPQPEVIRAIVSEGSPCCEAQHLPRAAAAAAAGTTPGE